MKHDILRRLGALLLCVVLALSLAVPSLADGDGTEGGGNNGSGTESGDNTGGDGPGGENDPDLPPAGTTITLSESSLGLERGKTAKLTVIPSAPPPSALKVDWSSSNENVAEVDETGTVTAVGGGTAKITAEVKLADGTSAKAECTVTVEAKYVKGFSFPFDELPFKSPETERTIRVDIRDSDADYEDIEFKSEDPSVVKIGDPEPGASDLRRFAKVTAVGPGETYVTATLKGIEGQKTLNTERRPVTVSGIVIYDSTEKTRLADSIANDKGRGELKMTMGTSENLVIKTYGSDLANISKVDWYSSNNVVVSVTNGRLTPRSPGTSRITATRGSYTASFDVTVSENKTGLVEIDGSVPAGVPMSFRSIREDISDKFYKDTKKDLYYVTSMYVSPSQGILYYGYISEADTGLGISMTNRLYYSSSSPDDYLLSGLSFVPRSTFSGNAEISYTAVSKDNTTVSGIIRIPVDAMEDVSYTTGSGQNVFFLGSDFNTICRLRTGRELGSVTFTLPTSSRGTLYYNYTAEGQYAEKVEANTRYSRTGSPNLDSVSFLPADGFEGSVRISYRGTDTAGGTFTGYVTVTVTDRGSGSGADVRFSGRAGREISFISSRFNTACREATGESLDYVQFTLPDSSDGTLYITSGSTERKVTEKTTYSRNAISNISFVPAKNAPDQIRIAYTGYSYSGTKYTGIVLIDYSGSATNEAIRYSVYSGRAVQFDDADFNAVCVEATGSTLNYVRFDLPAASQGLLCYNYGSTANVRSITSSTNYYRSSSSSNRIDRIWFLADTRYTGTVNISYTGYSNDGESYTGTVSIQVNSISPSEVRFSGSGSQPIAVSASQLRYACNAVMDKELSYIYFTGLPSSTQGRLYSGYTGLETGAQVVTGTQYYVSGTPGIDRISFVPRGGFSGTAVATYIGVSTSGEQVSGRISFVVSNSGVSGYFNDMAAYSWAVPAADYLYQNGVITGVGGGQYAPGQNIRRCDFVVMLCRAYNFGGGWGTGFSDVPANSYYASAVATASSLGIVNGDGNRFRPNDQLTRQDAMVIIKRTLEAAGWSLGSGGSSELHNFNDGGSVAAYAQDAVATLVRLGAVHGDNNGNLRPWDPINRAEAAVILHFVMTM